jgi:Acetyl-CoA carboxylase beta subunit
MAWFKREPGDIETTAGEKRVKTEGLWVKCDTCRQIIWKKDLDENLNVCPRCGRHFRINAKRRLELLFDDGQYETFEMDIASNDPLTFTDIKRYSDRLRQAQHDTGLKDAIVNAIGLVNGRRVVISAMEYKFIGGSMGSAVGEAITRAIERALAEKVPIIIISASGGARMMEGVISLMQWRKSRRRWRSWTAQKSHTSRC